MKTGVQRILEERNRQQSEEGWGPEHDDQHIASELARAAAVYALPPERRDRFVLKDYKDVHVKLWPFRDEWYKPTPDDRIRELEKAGALIAAEIDRLQRKNQEG